MFNKSEATSRNILCLAIALASILACPLPGQADEDHYTNMIIGNRAAGLAGAYTAISDDPSGLYYNPAGIVYAQTSNITASVNAFSAAKKTYKAVLGGKHDWVRESYSLLPNFFGIVQDLGKAKVGLSYAVPDSVIEDQDQQFSESFPSSISGIDVTSYTININKKENTYKFGPSLAMPLGQDFSMGLTVYFHYREKDFIKNEYVKLSNKTTGNTYWDYEWTNYYYESFEYGYEPVLGFMWSPVEKLSLGLRLSQTQILYSDTTSQTTYRSEIQGTITNSMPIRANTDTKRDQPVNIRLGAAWFASESLLFSSDFSYFTSTSNDFFGDKESTWDLAAGLEWYFVPSASLRCGGFSQNSNNQDITAGAQNQGEHLDLYGLSMSLSKYTRNSSITLGGSFSMGNGEAQVFADNTSIQDVNAWGYTLYLSTSYSF